jgi:glycosyltransferase involved in cell wall biosynthesis
MLKKTVSVSIVAANYNNELYLADFINSINNSSVLPKELIIINDGSTDNSLQILDRFSYIKYLRVINFNKNLGFCVALNAGIKNATAKYIMRIDPDDIILKERIEKQFDFLETNTEIDVVGSNVIYFSNETKKDIIKSNFPLKHEAIESAFKEGNHGIQHPSIMIRSRVMKKYKYNQENFKAEDYEIFALIINDGHKFGNILDPLTRMRVHRQSVSSNIRYDVIKNTFRLRDEIFNTSTRTYQIRMYYWYIVNYKKFMISDNMFSKVLYMIMAILSQPSKLFKRF